MINKHYFIGRTEDKQLYFLGIARMVNGELTKPLAPEASAGRNCVFDPVSGRLLASLPEVKGYLTAVISEFAFEGPSIKSQPFFQMQVHNWNDFSEDAFNDYMQGLPFHRHLVPLDYPEIEALETIVGLRVQTE